MQESRKIPGTPRGEDGAAEVPSNATPLHPDRRHADRRARPTRPWLDLFSPLRRARGRRATDQAGYVDRYSKQDVGLLLAIFLLNVADAFMTMLWLHRGGREANPVMDFFLDLGPAAFLAQKCLVVGFWLILLLVHKNFRFAKIGLYASLAVYSLLLIVHFGIIAFEVEPPPPDEPETALRVSIEQATE
ncbi:MAG: DUF5658 family protein [Myxococcota bacterium]